MGKSTDWLQFQRRHVSTTALLFLTLFCGFVGEFARAQNAVIPIAKAPIERDLDNLLSASQQAPFRFYASTDARHQNHDYLELKPNETRRIALTNGELLRLWFTSSNPKKCDVSLQNGAQNIVLLKNGKPNLGELWNKAWLLYPSQKATSSTRCCQLAANTTLIVTNRDKDFLKFFYQVSIRNSPTKNVSAPTEKASQIVSDWTLAPGKSHAFLTNTPVGIVDEIEVIIGSSDERGGNKTPLLQVLNSLRLRAFWDGEKSASVDVPLALLAAGTENSIPNSAIATLQKDRLVLRWPIVLPKNRKIEIVNSGKMPIGIYITTTLRALPENRLPTTRFHARFGSARTETNKPLTILQASGAGAFVGLNLDMRPISGATRRTFAYLEGNERIIADNRVLEGTGNEDFFNSAWYFPDKPFAREFHGLTRKTPAPPSVSAYRLMIPDAVPFKQSLRFDFGHSGRNKGDDMEYRWVAFWYQNAGGTFQIEDKVAQPNVNESENAAPNSSGNSMIYLGLIVLLGGALAAFQLSSRRKARGVSK